MIVSLYSMAAFCSRCRAAAKVLAEKMKRNSVHLAPLAVQLTPLVLKQYKQPTVNHRIV